MPIVQKMVQILLAIALAPAFLIGGIFYVSYQSSLSHEVLDHLSAIATIQQKRTEDSIEQHQETLASFTGRPSLLTAIDRYDRLHGKGDFAIIEQLLADTKSQIPSFKAVSILSPLGNVIASTEPNDVGKNYVDQAFFAQGLQRNDVTSTLQEDGNHQPVLDLVGPLKLDGRLLGVTVIETDLNALSAPNADYTGLGATGETILVKRTPQGQVSYLTPLRFKQAGAVHATASPSDTNNPVVQALAKHETTYTNALDYRGQTVLAATRYIPQADWGLVVKIDRSEAYQPLIRLGNLLLIVLFMTSAIILFVAFYLARKLNEPILALASVANKIKAGDLSQRVHITSKDEVGQLGAAFNAMAAQVEQVDQVKSEFVMLTSHQLRTPATAVKGFISMLLDGYAGKLIPKQKKLIKAAYDENERQISVINSILDFAKLDDGEIALERSNQDIGKVIEMSMAAQSPVLAAHRQTIIIHKPRQPVTVWIDAAKFRLVIDNLIYNAIKYSSRETQITIELEQKAKHVLIRVSDQGIGIAAKDMPKLFKRFSRISNPQTATVQGAGLGLYLAKKLVEMHGGTINVHSHPGKGTTFTIELPIIKNKE